MSFTTRYRNGQKLDVELWVTLKRTAVSNSEMIISCCGARDFFFLPNVRNIFSSRLRFRFFTRTTVFFSNDIEAGIGYRVFFVLWEVESSTFPTYIYIVSMRVRANIPDQDSVSSPHESVSLFDFHFFHPVKLCVSGLVVLTFRVWPDPPSYK